MLTPEVQTQVAEYFGEAPANPKACKYLDAGYGSYESRASATSSASQRPELLQHDRVLEDAAADCGDGRGADVHRLLEPGPRPGRRSRAEPRCPATHDRRRATRRRDPCSRRRHDPATPTSTAAAARRLRRRAARARSTGIRGAALAAAARRRRSAGWASSTSGRSRCSSSRRSGTSTRSPSAITHTLTLDNFQQILTEPGLPHDHAPHGGDGRAGDRDVDALLAFPIAFYMARVASAADPRGSSSCSILLPLWSGYLVRSTPGG